MGLSRTHSYRFLLVLSLSLATCLLYINKNILPSLTSGHHTEYFPFVNLSRPDRLKVVYGATDYWQGQLWKDLMNFTGCPYSNCISANSSTFRDVHKADVVIFALDYIQRFPQLSWQTRQSQHWLIITYESPAYPFNQFKASYNGIFNGSMTYRRDSTIYYPWGKVLPVQHKIPSILNVAQNKTKGAFAYVSNCKSRNYYRLDMIKELRKYIPIDVFGKCLGHDSPCPPLRKGGNPICETQTHQPYRFYLSFENSLCRDYITEKFWDRLWSPSHFVPVAMGGLTLEDYSSVAPPDSFLHVYNFSSVHDLGQHLRSLMENNDAYNKYHQWRRQHEVTTDRNIAACDLCKLANEKPVLPAVDNIADWWNSNGNCRTF